MKAEVNGITLHYRDEGSSGNSLPLLLLHAFPLSGEMWQPQVEALKGEARIIVPDIRGFGGTDAQANMTTLDEMARDVLSLLDHLQIERVTLGGLSMGGYLAFALLRQAKDRVLRLILADTKAGADTDEARNNRHSMAEKAEREGSGPIAEMMVEKLLGRTTRETRPEIVEQVKAIIRGNGGTGIAAAQRAMAARPESLDRLPSLDIPALVIVGEEDELTPPAEAENMAAALPNAQLAVLAGAGHLSNLEQPEAFNAEIRQFLRQM